MKGEYSSKDAEKTNRRKNYDFLITTEGVKELSVAYFY